MGKKVLENPVQCNELLHTVSFWLEERKKTAYKLFHMQCLQSLDHEMFLKTVKKESKKKKKGSAKGSESELEPEPEESNEENKAEENPDDDLVINTVSTIDFKINYDDFKTGLMFTFWSRKRPIVAYVNKVVKYTTIFSQSPNKILMLYPK